MSKPSDKIEGLEAKRLFQAALGEPTDDPEAAARAAAEEQRLRAEIAERLPDVELLELLGQGGMGYVWRARQTKLSREVALKVVAPEVERRSDFADRFAREAQALARLSHPNIVGVHDYGQEDTFCWLMMEYVEGSNLRDVIRDGKLEAADALALVPKICSALQYAHDQGVVHRDVKPENILLDGEGGLKIADFGLAKLTGTPAALVTLTGSQQVLGTFRYMAPEQLDRPLEVDHRADIYSLGVVFYEMLTGEVPMGRFDPPSHTSGTSTGVDDVVLRALQKEPERRYQRASEVTSDLESLERGEQPAATNRTVSAEQPRLSMRALASGLMVGIGIVPCLMITGALFVAGTSIEPERSRQVSDPSFRLSIASILVAIPVIAGLGLMGGSSWLGFRALSEIRAAWPRLYGVGMAAFGAWAGILLAVNAAVMTAVVLLMARFGSSGVEDARSLGVPLACALGLVIADAAFLVRYRRRFLRELGTGSSES